MEQPNTDLMQQPAAVSEPVLLNATEKPPISLRTRALAFALLALGYLVCRFPIHEHPLLGLAYGLALYGLTLWHFRGKVGSRPLYMLAVGTVFLLSHLLTDNGPVRFFARWLAVLLWGYAVYCAGGNSQEEKPGDMFVPEFFKANVLMPFSRLGAFFTTAFNGNRRNLLKSALLVLLGLGLALIPLVLVVNLLEYDMAFSKLLDSLVWGNLAEPIFDRLLFLLLAVAIATLLMSTLWGSEEHRMARVLDRERWNAFSIRRQFLPLVASCAMLIPLLLVYGLFFFSQWPLYTAAFTSVLPKGYAYADYARQGFFELCAVCAINGTLYLFVSLFTKRGPGEGVRRMLLTLLCLCSLVLAATAASKMVLYIRTYGLTPLRVYSSWAMILLMAAFLLALASAYWKKLNLIRSLFCLFALMFGFLCVVDTNALIAEYNVRAYEQGRLDSVDTSVFWDLGDSAAPAAARLADNPKYGTEVQNFLSHHGERSALRALCHGIPGLKARSVCAPWWVKTVTVHVRIETEDSFEALSGEFRVNGYTYDAGTCINADNSPYKRGQKTFFELEEQPRNLEREALQNVTVRFRLTVSGAEGKGVKSNWQDCAFGETTTVTLTGSREEGYTIARTDR